MIFPVPLRCHRANLRLGNCFFAFMTNHRKLYEAIVRSGPLGPRQDLGRPGAPCPCGSGKTLQDCCLVSTPRCSLARQKYTPTARSLAERPGDHGEVDLKSLPRLTFWPSRTIETNYYGLTDFVQNHCSPDTLFYLDTNFLTSHNIPNFFWRSLFTRTVVFTSLVWEELNDWLRTPRVNQDVRRLLLQARIERPMGIEFDPDTRWRVDFEIARSYYVNLLAERRRTAVHLIRDFSERQQREASEDELRTILQAVGTEASLRMLRKAVSESARPGLRFFTDEELTATAVADGIIRGRPMVILTRDKDVQEHFVKLLTLMDRHYQAMLFAEQLCNDKLVFGVEELALKTAELNHHFVEGTANLVKKPGHTTDDFLAFILPKNFKPILTQCFWVGGQADSLVCSQLAYKAEAGMARLLSTKGNTRGLSTDRLSGRNCHVTGFPWGVRDPRSYAIVAEDKKRVIDIMAIPSLDIAHAQA